MTFDLYCVRNGHGFSCFVIHFRSRFFRKEIWDVLDERSLAKDIEALKAVADSEDRLAKLVGVIEKKIIDGVAARISCGSAGRARGVEAGGIDVGVAAGQKYGVAAFDHYFYFCRALVEGDADRFGSSQYNCAFVLRDGALAVFMIGGVGHRNSNARGHENDCSPYIKTVELLDRTAEEGCPHTVLENDRLAGALNCRQGLHLAVMADFHRQGKHKDDAAGDERQGQSNVSVGDAHVGMRVAQGGNNYGAEDCKQQAYGEADQSAEKCSQGNADWDGVPAGRAGWIHGHTVNAFLLRVNADFHG
jgi:hypothetical protein